MYTNLKAKVNNVQAVPGIAMPVVSLVFSFLKLNSSTLFGLKLLKKKRHGVHTDVHKC